MLGEKGDLIMRQMEDLTTGDPHSPAPVTNSRPSQGDPFNDDQKPNLGNQESSILDNMLSMEDFEKYIAQN
ncbi:unnamed protein product [Phytophthora lilii]|uniref:Unnamed protein product n=1 Tax=Phytophthora lilii TaxID=2077276 RepID=A0A9W6TM61_9STRA|nr:unnamed protein product [Phytophthora lilii]